QCLLSVLGLANELQVVGDRQERSQPAADHRVIVDDGDARCAFLRQDALTSLHSRKPAPTRRDPSTSPWPALDSYPRANGSCPLVHDTHAEPTSRRCLRVEAAPIV